MNYIYHFSAKDCQSSNVFDGIITAKHKINTLERYLEIKGEIIIEFELCSDTKIAITNLSLLHIME